MMRNPNKSTQLCIQWMKYVRIGCSYYDKVRSLQSNCGNCQWKDREPSEYHLNCCEYIRYFVHPYLAMSAFSRCKILMNLRFEGLSSLHTLRKKTRTIPKITH